MFEPTATAPHLDSTNRVVLAACQRLPVYPNKPAISEPVRTSRFANRGLMRRKQPISIAS